mmetsp:Transcript_15748/g.14250  ORF Transcript_15748/g.14250 Transcript_15748/m.14250 type:complete len:156 (-) Transcript_15748:20-487(-)
MATAKLTSLQNSWASGFFDCFGYKDKDKGCVYIPFFIPMSVCGTCCILGRITTILEDEPVTCCEMGKAGSLMCLISLPIGILGPFGGFCWYGLNGIRMREEVIEKYHIRDDEEVGPCIAGVCYPCNYFQLYTTIKDIRRDSNVVVTSSLTSKILP